MDILWFSNNTDSVVTIYETNLTLNTVASTHFQNSYLTLVGFNKKDNTLIIKSLNKEEAQSGAYKDCELHPISIKKSYGRINGKNIIRNIQKFFPLNFQEKNLFKFKSSWDEEAKNLIIYMGEEIK